jgi:cyclopropane fatty-acyl-phospholipid synthase-like methyltransferase
MRYGPTADDPLEQMVLDSDRSPRALIDTFVPLVQARAIMAALDLGLFEQLADSASDATDLARRVDAEPTAISLLLRVLHAAGYLSVDGSGRYRCRPFVANTLTSGGPDSLRSWVGMMRLLWPTFSQLEPAIRSGSGFDLHATLRSEQEWAVYQQAMLESARRVAPEVALMTRPRIPVRRVLDIGGGHGLFGGLIAREHPGATSDVLDLPEAIAAARPLSEAEGLLDVVDFVVGNAISDEITGRYEIVFIGNLLHHLSEAQTRDLLRKAHAALTPGGTLAIFSMLEPAEADEVNCLAECFTLFFLLTSSARLPARATLERALLDTGFELEPVHHFPMGMALLTAHAPIPAGEPA